MSQRLQLFFISLFCSIYVLDAQNYEPIQLKIDQVDRQAWVYLPKSFNQNKTYPLLFVFHGGAGRARQIAEFSGFNTLADQHEFIAIYPQGFKGHWNDGRQGEKFKAQDAQIDDVQFILQLKKHCLKKYPIRKNALFATGISNGGIFCQRLAIEASTEFDAVASITAQIAIPLKNHNPKRPIPILIMNGTKDPFVPYKGGAITPHLMPKLAKWMKKKPNRGSVLSTSETLQYWVRQHQLDNTPMVSLLENKAKLDGCRVEVHEWKDSQERSKVLLYKIIGGGHTWPGKAQYQPIRVIGRVCKDIDGSETIWAFFSKFL